jgi:ankyrin repeat protein
MIPDISRRTPLMQAAYNDEAEIIQTIFDVVKSTNEADRKAGRRQSCNLYKMSSMQDKSGYTAMQFAVLYSNFETVNVLMRYPQSLWKADNHKRTPVMAAAAVGKLEELRLMLSSTAVKKKRLYDLIAMQDEDGDTALHYAALNGHAGAVKIILDALHEAGETIDSKLANNEGHSALHVAVLCGEVDCIKVLYNIMGNFPDQNNMLPIHCAAWSDNYEVLQTLIELLRETTTNTKQISEMLNAIDGDGCTPLMYCAGTGDGKGVELLLKNGADPSVCPKSGPKWNVLHYIVQQYAEHPLLRSRILSAFNVIHAHKSCGLAIYIQCADAVEINDRKIGFETVLFKRVTPIQLAAATASIELLRAMLDKISVSRSDQGTVYDMKYIVPRRLMNYLYPDGEMPVHNDGDEGGDDSDDDCAELDPHDSCCEVIYKACHDEGLEGILQIEPIEAFLTKFSNIRAVAFSMLFLQHVVYMSCFSAYVIPTCSLHFSQSKPDYRFAGFLIWPILIFLYEVICLWKVVVSVYARKTRWGPVNIHNQGRRSPRRWWMQSPLHSPLSNTSASQDIYPLDGRILSPPEPNSTQAASTPPSVDAPVHNIVKKTIITGIFHGLYKIMKPLLNFIDQSTSTYIRYFETLSHISSLTFIGLIGTWFYKYCSVKNSTIDSYTEIASIALVSGWLHTLEYVKGFTTIHAFSIILKVVFIKDVLRILFIYMFVLVGFALALYVYVDIEPSWSALGVVPTNTSLSNVVYQMFGMMTGQSDLFQLSTENVSNFHRSNLWMIRLLFVLYIVLSTIVLMNILIAMMNNTYNEVVGLKETLWCVEALRFLNWIAKDNVLWTADAFRHLLSKTIFRQMATQIEEDTVTRRVENRLRTAQSRAARKVLLNQEIKDNSELNSDTLDEILKELRALKEAMSHYKEMTWPSDSQQNEMSTTKLQLGGVRM